MSEGNLSVKEPLLTIKEDLWLKKIWFAQQNKELSEKRSREEGFIMLNAWSTAKQRVAEEIASKIERWQISSNP